MNVYVSYKQTGIPEEVLDENMGKVRDAINNTGNESMIFWFDGDLQNPSKVVIRDMLKSLKKSDLHFVIIGYKEKSEGILAELGMAYALGKKTIAFIKDQVRYDYYLTGGMAEKVIHYKDWDDLVEKISKLEELKEEA